MQHNVTLNDNFEYESTMKHLQGFLQTITNVFTQKDTDVTCRLLQSQTKKKKNLK